VVSFRLALLAGARVYFRSHTDTALEVLALRQQVAVFKWTRPRPPLTCLDRLFWIVLREPWNRWQEVLVIVKRTETLQRPMSHMPGVRVLSSVERKSITILT